MLSIARMKQGPDYYLKLARGAYYTEGGEPLGQWFGRRTRSTD